MSMKGVVVLTFTFSLQQEGNWSDNRSIRSLQLSEYSFATYRLTGRLKIRIPYGWLIVDNFVSQCIQKFGQLNQHRSTFDGHSIFVGLHFQFQLIANILKIWNICRVVNSILRNNPSIGHYFEHSLKQGPSENLRCFEMCQWITECRNMTEYQPPKMDVRMSINFHQSVKPMHSTSCNWFCTWMHPRATIPYTEHSDSRNSKSLDNSETFSPPQSS